MKYPRIVKEIICRDKISNDTVREELGVNSILDVVE